WRKVERRDAVCLLTEARCFRAHPSRTGRLARASGGASWNRVCWQDVAFFEDEPLISLDVTTRLQDAGARVVAASRLEKALGLAIVRSLRPACWILTWVRSIARRCPVSLSIGASPSSFIVAACTAHSGNGRAPSRPRRP